MHGLRTLIFDVKDLAAAKRFYAEALGKPAYFDQPFYVGFDVEGYELGLRPAEAPITPGATAYLGVDDVGAAIVRLTSLGCTVREPAMDVGDGIVTAVVVDPFGNALGLIRNLQFAPKLAAAAADDISPRTIVKEAVVPLPRERVWQLWSTTAGVKEWLVDDAKIELRPGGAYEVYFLLDKPLGMRGSETCRVLSFVPQRLLSFTWNAPPSLPKTRFLHTWVVVELADSVEGTDIVVTHTGWPASGLRDEPQWEQTFQYFDKAWTQVLADLLAFAQTGKKP